MHILAFDSCFGAVSVAVAHKDAAGARLLVETFERRRAGHAERLLPMVAEAMTRAGIGFPELGRIAVTLGPGTFTGVRTGIAAARALVLASGCPAVGVGTLAALAFAAKAELGAKAVARPMAVALAARPGLVYFQHFSAGAAALSAPALLAPQACAELLAGVPAIVVGSAAASIKELLEAGGATSVTIETDLADAEPRAAAVAMLGSELAPGHPLQPLYLRAPDAKPQAGALPRADS